MCSGNAPTTARVPAMRNCGEIREKIFRTGDVIAMPTGTIHSVSNDSDQVTLSLHVYGKHINFTQRSQFDPDEQTEKPFIVHVD